MLSRERGVINLIPHFSEDLQARFVITMPDSV